MPATDTPRPANRADPAEAGMGQLLSIRASGFTSPVVVSAIRDEVNLLALCRQIPQRATLEGAPPAGATPAAPRHPAPQLRLLAHRRRTRPSHPPGSCPATHPAGRPPAAAPRSTA